MGLVMVGDRGRIADSPQCMASLETLGRLAYKDEGWKVEMDKGCVSCLGRPAAPASY